MKYKELRPGVEYKIEHQYLYVRHTSKTRDGLLVQGGHINRVYRMDYDGTEDNALKPGVYCMSNLIDAIVTGVILPHIIQYGSRIR